MSRPTGITIDLAAIAHNLTRVKAFAPRCAVMAMVKANAYGHGVVHVAPGLAGASAFGVAALEEGIALREAGNTQPIVLLEGLFSSDEIADAAKHHFTLVVHHLAHLEMLEKVQTAATFSVWLKINTGMHRLGIPLSAIDKFYSRLAAAPAVRKPIGLMTHFADADVIGSDSTLKQIESFNQAVAHLPGPRSLANSAGIIAWPEARGDWIRPGLLLYGASPFADKIGADFGLQPVMTLWSHLIAITPVKPGGRVGYGGTWTAPAETLIGVVGVGYGDGYPQFAKNGTPVLVNGVECPLVGRVSMDMLTVDLGHQPDAQIGDPVILWGKGLPVERVARHCGTSPYELLTRRTMRPKVEVKASSSKL